MCVCAKFQTKQIILTFSVQICQKMDLGLAIQKTNVGIRIGIIKMPCVPIFTKNEQVWLFRPKFAQKGVKISKIGIRIWNLHTWDAMCTNFQKKRTTLNFGLKFAQKWIFGLQFQKSKSGFGINTSNKQCVPVFSQNR